MWDIFKKYVSGATFKAKAFASLFIVVGVFAFFSVDTVYASTSYETAAPLSTQFVDFPISGSGVNRTPNYIFAYRLPDGTTFDRIQISVPTSVTSYSTSVTQEIYTASSTWFYDCLLSNCKGNDTLNYSQTVLTESNPESGTLQWLFASTTTLYSGQYVIIRLPSTDFYFNGSTNQPQAAAINGSNFTKSYMVPAVKFCDGACDNDFFSAIPNLSASPWGRLISPANNSVLTAGEVATLQFQVNTGTTSADNVQIRFTSNLQSLTPYDYNLTQTGLNDFSYDLNLPSVDDYIQLVVDVRQGTTSLYISQTYSLNVRVGGSSVGVNPEEIAYCDSLSGLTWSICEIAVFLWVPSETSMQQFSDLNDSLSTKSPFIYVYQASDLVETLYNSPSLASSTITVEILGGELDLISVAQLQAVPYTSWLRTILGYVMWLMFFALMYRKVLKVFNTNPQ